MTGHEAPHGRRKALLALVLLVPAPSVGALCAMAFFPDATLGTVLFGLSKIWMLVLPVAWHRWVDREPFSLSPARRGGFGLAALSGLGISGFILAVLYFAGDALVDRHLLVARLEDIGLASPGVFAAGAAYWILANSVLEEYVWRWFCVKQCERLMRPTAAVLCSALFFTVHHIVIMRVYFGPLTVLVFTVGIFAGAAIWSAMYLRYRSIWPGYLSHAIVDLCIFGLAAFLLFGGATG